MSRTPPGWPRPDGGGGASGPPNGSPSGPPSRVGARPQRARVRRPSSAPPWGRSTGHRRTAASQAARATAPEAQGAARSARCRCADASHPGPRARVRCSGRVTARSSAGQSSSPPRHPRWCDPALTTRSPERAASRSDPGPTGASLPDRPRSDDQQPAPWLASAPHGAPAYPLFNNPGILNPSPSPGARLKRRQLPAKAIVAIARRQTAPLTRQATHATTDEGPQQIGMSRIVATSKLPVLREFVLHAFELLLGDNGRDRRNRDPVLPRSHAPGRSRRAGTARLLEAPGIDLAGVDRVGQDAAQGLHVPAALTPRRRHPVLVQLLGQAIETASLLSIPDEHLSDCGGFGRVLAQASRVTGVIGIHTVAVRRLRPGQQDSGLKLAKTATAHPFRDQAALVLGHRAADLQQELVVWILAHRPVEGLDLAACGRDLLPEEHPMHIVAGQPVRGGDQDAIQLTHRRPISQPLQARPFETGAAVAIIPEDVLGRHAPPLLEGMGLQALQLLSEAVGLCLALGGYPCIDPDPHDDPPLEEARGRPGPRRRFVVFGSRP